LLIPYMLLAGLSGAAPVALVPMVLAETLGLRRFGTLFGWIGFTLTGGIFVGPLLVGKLYDLSGNYTEGFLVCVAIALAGAVASIACTAPRRAVGAAAEAVLGLDEMALAANTPPR
jgi:MFS family permease